MNFIGCSGGRLDFRDGFLYSYRQKTTGKVMRMTVGSELALRAKHDTEAMERLKRQYQPLVAARVMLHMGFYRPEYMEAGYQALEEAVMSYQPDKGGFTGYLRRILKFRLIDLRRREKLDRMLPESSLSEEHRVRAVNEASVAAHREQEEADSRREEIERYQEALSRLGLTLQEVAAASPKQEATRSACRRACRYMLLHPELLDRACMGRVPGKELSEALDVGLKTWERHRKYLVACAVAVAGDFHCISGYILDREGEA